MRCETEFAEEGIEDEPLSALLHQGKRNRYGSVPGLDDEELADPWELERQVMLEQWGPVLMLPVRGRQDGFRPELDECGVDWGAFATVDFERTMPEFDKARYKADRLREKLKDVVIMFETVSERLPRAKWRVLKYLRMGLIDEEQLASEDMRALWQLARRVQRLREEIAMLRRASQRRQEAERQRLLARLEV